MQARNAKPDSPLVVIAIGGNSLIADQEHRTVLDQYVAAGETSHQIAPIAGAGYRVVITHGNGPQVGFILLRSELSKDVLHQVPLENCVADTQGAIGYQIAQTLQNELQVVVDGEDAGFENPSKPIGPFMTEKDAKQHADNDGWVVAEDAGRGWRRMVPSPLPLEIIELPTIRTLLDAGIMVVAAGGGGIPVIRLADGTLRGCDAVIDKDKVSGLLACQLNADVLIFSTSVNFNTPKQTDSDKMNVV